MTGRVIIIAEAGVNHNGDVAMAKGLIDLAADAGADFVKFQTFSAGRLATAAAGKANYQMATTDKEESQKDMLRRLELSHEAHGVLLEHCRRRGIGFLSTGFDIESLDFLVELGIPMIKVPSGEITNLPYLRHAASLGLPAIVSTGMASMEEVGQAISAMEAGGLKRTQLTILHCTTEYPTQMEDVNLRAMLSMRDAFGVEVGYSDHTLGIEVAISAVALGARVVEKHFTLDCSLPGPDHRASLPPAQLAAMVQAIRNIEKALGDGEKKLMPAEEGNKAVTRKSIVAACAIRAGESFCAANLAVKRPGSGISPMLWDELLGKPAPRDFAIDELIES